MSKSRKKRNSYNTEVVDGLASKYSITAYYVRQCLNDNRKGIFPDKIQKEYNEIVSAVNTTIITELKQD